MNIKELFNNAKEKVKNLNMSEKISNAVNKVKDGKIVSAIKRMFEKIFFFINKEKVDNTKKTVNDFIDNNNDIKNAATGNIMSRFQNRISKFIKHNLNKIDNSTENGNKVSGFFQKVIKIGAIILSIGFGILVLYCIKDVFLQCLLLVATCAAIMVSIEVILSTLSVATGYKF